MIYATDLVSALLFVVISLFLGLLIGVVIGYVFRVKQREGSLRKTEEECKNLVENAKKEGDKAKKEMVLEAKQEIFSLRKEAEKEIKTRKSEAIELENKLNQRENQINNRVSNLDKREELLNSKENKLDEKKNEIEELKSKIDDVLKKQEAKLIEISNVSVEDAKEMIMSKVREDMSNEIALYIRDEEEKAKSDVEARAKNMLALAIQKYASDTTSEKTVSVVGLPSDEMKGRIIGREGRNIRTIEALTGVDLIVDDTPEAVVLSGFDPVRREIARKALETLVSDGRIHPGRIEEIVERSRLEVESFIREKGEEAVFTANIGRVHPDLVKLLGRLYYRTSFGQNVLNHSIETAFLAAKLAAEIGENEVLARRAGLLHDIGKAVDHEVEGSHVEIGANLAKKYHEPKEVIDAIESHHGDKDPESIIAVLVAAADALSAARPGARSESLENYIKRLEQLEQISNNVKGVASTYAIQAGREIRVIVKPDEVDDLSTFKVAREIKEEIEKNLSYPGTIKVTVVRETRAVDIAK
jgi:ribonuclease Y